MSPADAGNAAASPDAGNPATSSPDAALFDLPVGDLLDRVAAREPAPGGGAVAAVVVALAAGLAAMAARYSDRQLPDSARLAERADQLRLLAARLGDQDAAAYRSVLAAYRAPADDDGTRRRQISAALGQATDPPLRIAEVGVEVAALGALLAGAGNPNLAGDAAAAATLADGAVRVAAGLARINIGLGGLDEGLSARADRSVAAAADASRTAEAAAFGTGGARRPPMPGGARRPPTPDGEQVGAEALP